MSFDGHRDLEFIDRGIAPELYADGLYDVEVIGQNCWFLLYQLKKSPKGILYREAAFTVRLPCEAVGPGIALTIRKCGSAIIIPAAVTAVRELARGWIN